jgi:hypothetical protein
VRITQVFSRFRPRLEPLEDRSCPSGPAVDTFAGNAQHTGLYQQAAQPLSTIHWQTPVDLQPQYSGSDLLIHYGAPLITAHNTVLVPVKTGAGDGFEVNAFNGATGAPLYTLATDYLLPAHNWTPSYAPALVTTSTGTRLYYPGAGGIINYIDDPDSANPGAPTRLCFYTSLADYQSNAGAFNSSVFIDTPITGDADGNIYFGFRVQGTAPAPLDTTQSGYARIDAAGNATYVLAGSAAGDGNVGRDSHNAAPALSNDGGTLYVVVKSPDTDDHAYLLALNSTTLATEHKVFLKDPSSGNPAGVPDDGTASPMVAPDGTVYFGVLGNPYNGSRGYLLHFSGDLATEMTPGAFGWDNTPAVVPSGMVGSYTGTSPYLIFTKDNNYAGVPGGGDGINQVAVLDPNATETDPHNDGNPTLQVMREVLTVPGPTPDPENVGPGAPHAVREWCINTAAVNPATGSVYFPSEDGNLYQWDLGSNSLARALTLGTGIGEAYVPTAIGPDGTVYSINNATLFAVGSQPGVAVSVTSSSPDVRGNVLGQAVTFTATVTNTGTSGPTPTGSITFKDGSDVLAAVALNDAGQATYTTSALPSGARFISAVYSGDGHIASGTATLVQAVHASGTTTALTSSPDPAPFGKAVTFTATVTPGVAGLGTPTGMVTFLEGTTVLGQVPLNGSGQAALTTSGLGVGSHTVTAVYYSDPIYATSSGDDSDSPQVVRDATTTTVTSAPNPSVFGQAVTVTALVAARDSGAGIPSGTVTFSEGGTVLGAGALDGSDQATLTTSALAVGGHTVTATYGGDDGFTGSSGSAGETVQSGTSTAVTASAAVPPPPVPQQVVLFGGWAAGKARLLLAGVGFAPDSLVLVNGQVVPALFQGWALEARVSRRLLRRYHGGSQFVVQVLTPGVGLSEPLTLPTRGLS